MINFERAGPRVKDSNPDTLEILFGLQKTYSGMKHERNNTFPQDKNAKVGALAIAMIHELIELREEINWKWWKPPHAEDDEKIAEELIDVLHFWISAALVLGWDHNEVFMQYMKKYKKNHQRQGLKYHD